MQVPGYLRSPSAFAGAVATEAPLRLEMSRTGRRVARAGRDGGTVVAGPWLSEIGFELLYWIPFLRRQRQRHGLAPEQVTAVSRGGVADWYRDVAARYADAHALLEPDEFHALQARRLARAGHEKQLTATRDERALVAGPLGEGRGAVWLHPLAMYGRLRHYWAGDRDRRRLDAELAFARMPGPPAPEVELPPSFVAVKAYFSMCFPPTAPNRRLVRELILGLAERTEVVVLSTGLPLDGHEEAEALRHPRVLDLAGRAPPASNLALQTRVAARADAIVSTYGGPAYLGQFLGVPTVALASVANHNPAHLVTACHAAERIGTRAPDLVDVSRAGAVAEVTARALAAAQEDALSSSPSTAANSAAGGSSAKATSGPHASSSVSS